MRYAEYGKTGKMVSVVGFGGMRFDESMPDAHNAELVRHACAKGINYFDTAPGYGKSEDYFGLAFRDMPGEYYVSTKAMPGSNETAEKARASLMRSMERMKVDKVHFFHVWCLRKMEHYELAMKPGGMYDGLVKCKEEGLIDHIAISSHQPGGDIRRMLSSGKFDGVLMGINILNFPFRWDGVEAAIELGCGVVAMNPLGGGQIPKHADRLGFLARDGRTPTEAALRFVVGCPQITIALVGFTKTEHVALACRVADEAEPFDQAELARIGRHLGENMNAVCTGCGYCKDCPQEIPVPSYLQVYNEKAMFGARDEEMAKQVKDQHVWGALAGRRASAAECIECGRCEEACTQHLPIIERLKELAEWEKEP